MKLQATVTCVVEFELDEAQLADAAERSLEPAEICAAVKDSINDGFEVEVGIEDTDTSITFAPTDVNVTVIAEGAATLRGTSAWSTKKPKEDPSAQ